MRTLAQGQELSGKPENQNKFFELPFYPNSFIGRSHQIQSICSLLQDETVRLVTVRGPGGMGKTRLSIKVGEELAGVFEDGVCFVPLDMLIDYQDVPRQIGMQLGLKESFQETWTDVIIEFLIEKHLLLILDNLEQILESADFISKILKSCHRVKILATSREILGLPEEIEYPLGSLNRANPKLFPEPKDLLQFEAISLFVQRAQLSSPDFQLNEENAKAVVQICNLLEGLPLPIELAAARLKMFSPEVIFLKLSADNKLLKTNNKHVVHRHQTIRNMVKWSYDLLDIQEKQLFQQLALFRGGITLDSLAAVCPDVDALEIIESFINKSLIVKGEEVNLIPRFRMLKIIRDYGLEQLENNPEKNSYYEKFAAYFEAFAEKGADKLRSVEQVKWIARIDAEYQNLSSALEWLITYQAERAARMGVRFWRFHLNRGFLREGLSMIEYLLGLTFENKSITAKLLEGAGALSHNQGNYLKAKEYFERSLEISKQLNNKAEIAKALNNLSWSEWRIGNYDATIDYAKNALDIFIELGDELGQAKSQNNLAWTFQCRGVFEEAANLQRKVLAIHRRKNNRHGIAFAQACLGRALMKLGKDAEADQLIQQAIRQFAELKNQQLEAFSYLIQAEYYCEMQHYETAKEILTHHCLPAFEKIGDLWGVIFSHQILGEILFKSDRSADAKAHWEQALEMSRHSSDIYGEARACLGLSQVYKQNKELTTAKSYLKRGLELAAQMKSRELLQQAYRQKQLHSKSKSVAVEPRSTQEDPFIQKLRSIIEGNLSDPAFSVKDLCMEVGLSHSQLHRKISALTGQSITQYIRSIRLEKACELLKNPQLTIAAVAYDSGFKDSDYFYRVFKKRFQMTPKEYRKLVEQAADGA